MYSLPVLFHFIDAEGGCGCLQYVCSGILSQAELHGGTRENDQDDHGLLEALCSPEQF
jgi:hypothetical protein